MSTIKTNKIVNTGSSTDNLTLANNGNVTVGADLIATKQNGCQRIILEQFYSPCDGSVIALQDGNHTLTQPSAYDATDSFVDIVGSSITYTPPTGTTQVIYEYEFQMSYSNGGPILSMALYLDSDEVTNFRYVLRASDDIERRILCKWGFNIGGTASTASGRVASWTSDKTMKLQVSRYSSSYAGRLHETNHWGTTSDDIVTVPCLGITAIG